MRLTYICVSLHARGDLRFLIRPQSPTVRACWLCFGQGGHLPGSSLILFFFSRTRTVWPERARAIDKPATGAKGSKQMRARHKNRRQTSTSNNDVQLEGS